MNSDESSHPPSRFLILAAFAAVYLIWGSTYLAIRYAVETMPPFLMAGSRFFVAGVILFLWTKRRHPGWPAWLEWRDASIVGTLLLLGGNGGVTWAEQTIPSSIAALMIAVTPLWIVLLEWREGRSGRPGLQVMAGLAVGFTGVALLVLKGKGFDGQSLPLAGLLALLTASVTWAFGSLFSRRARKPKSALLTIGMQMTAGGAIMMLFGLGAGEARKFDLTSVSALSIGAWFYLMLAGALIGFTAYVWLLQVCAPSKVSTYAFVNPLIAVTLGCTLGNEPFSIRLLIATLLIGAAVLLIIRNNPAMRRPRPNPVPAHATPAERLV